MVQTALDEEEQAALRTLERERNARMRAESELALARTRSAEKKAQLAAAKAQLAMLQRSSAGVPSDPLQPLLELKQAASRIPDQDAAVQELKMLQQERERLLEMKQRSQLENAQLSDPLDAPRTPQLRQAIAEHDAELDRIRSSSKGALPSRSSSSLGTAASQEDLEAEALLAQYEAELYSEELQASGGEDTAATEAVLMRTASGSLIEEANRLIATTSRRLIELEHERAAQGTAHAAGWSTFKLVCSFDWAQSDILLWCRRGFSSYHRSLDGGAKHPQPEPGHCCKC